MKYLVTFEREGVYLADHQRGRRICTSLLVHAPDARSAEIHALRTVSGDLGALTTVRYTAPLIASPAEVSSDTRQQFRTPP